MASARMKQQMTIWHASVKVSIDGDADAIAQDLLERLGEDAVSDVEPGALVADVTVQASDIVAAGGKSVDRITKALAELRVVVLGIDALSVQSEADLEAELRQLSFRSLSALPRSRASSA